MRTIRTATLGEPRAKPVSRDVSRFNSIEFIDSDLDAGTWRG